MMKKRTVKDVTPFEIIKGIIELGWEVHSADLIIYELDKIESQNAALVEGLCETNEEILRENDALSELLSPLVDVELERDTLKAALDIAMSENQRLTKIVEDYEAKEK